MHVRTILTCSILSVAWTIASTSALADADQDMVCTTVDPPLQDFQINDFAAEEGISTTQLNDAALAATTEFKLTPYGTAFLNQRWRQSDGLTPNSGLITLGIAFLEGSEIQKDAVRKLASNWLIGDLDQKIAFKFDVASEHSQIRITFAANGGNNSLVGRQNLSAPVTIRTMNLAQVTARAIQHEFGHALGLHHEHMHPTNGIIWNEQVVIDEMLAMQGWLPKTTKQNILNKYTVEAACVGDPLPNRDSIMMYPIPKRWTLNNFSTKLNSSISERDKMCLIGLYKV